MGIICQFDKSTIFFHLFLFSQMSATLSFSPFPPPPVCGGGEQTEEEEEEEDIIMEKEASGVISALSPH